MEPTLEGLATAAAVALAKTIGTRAWDEARQRFARLFGRGEARKTKLTEDRLDAAAATVTGAGDADAARDEVARKWETRLVDLLEEHPQAANELDELVQLIGRDVVPGNAPTQVNIATGHGMVNAVQHGRLDNHFGAGGSLIDGN